uniref:Uncharacterized protein n=1 Tax=Setaria digitata TaxID=48799 RepID=A0A915Q2J2_9BILA
MDREALDDEDAIDEPNYFCYKAYIKTAGYAIFILYSVFGIKRIYEHLNHFMIVDRCTSCRKYEGNNVDMLFWGIYELSVYGMAPLTALVALIHADLEWFFPTYALRVLFPSFMLVGPIFFTIFSYILYWLIDLVIDVQQISENLLDMTVWKRCIWASGLLISNIYALLLAIVVSQLIYYQHYINIEERVIHHQPNPRNGRVQHRRIRRHWRQYVNQLGNAGVLNQNNQANLENV